MNESEISEFEQLADILAQPPNNEAYQKANESLNSFTNDLNNWDKIHSILELSK